MNSLIILIIMTTVPSIYTRLKQEAWYDPQDITFLSDADFKMASMMSVDDFQEVSTPFEDPEAQHTYYEGDMMIKADDERKVAMYSAKRWPNGEIPYMMENKFSQEERAAIARGIMTLQEETCIKFVPKEDHHDDYVWMRSEPGCAAHVGRIGGQQWLILGKGCFSIETVVHELMHSVGFIHEQSRPDRDAYVKIMWDNIKDGAKRNFRKHTTDYLADHGFPYDLMSVMHYRQYAFSKNRKPTIIPRKPVSYLRCRGLECPSDEDIKKINYLYKCKDGKSEFYGSNELSAKKPSHKKGSKNEINGNKWDDKYDNKFDKSIEIGEQFYDSMPEFNGEPDHRHNRRHNPKLNHRQHPVQHRGHSYGDHDDGHQRDHSDYEYQSPEGPCVGNNCYSYYDSDIDRHMPGETQLMPSVLPTSGVYEQNHNENKGITSWFTSLFHW